MLSSRHPNRLVFQLHGIFETNDLLRAGSLQCLCTVPWQRGRKSWDGDWTWWDQQMKSQISKSLINQWCSAALLFLPPSQPWHGGRQISAFVSSRKNCRFCLCCPASLSSSCCCWLITVMLMELFLHFLGGSWPWQPCLCCSRAGATLQRAWCSGQAVE